jgi:hypothetical protein
VAARALTLGRASRRTDGGEREKTNQGWLAMLDEGQVWYSKFPCLPLGPGLSVERSAPAAATSPAVAAFAARSRRTFCISN